MLVEILKKLEYKTRKNDDLFRLSSVQQKKIMKKLGVPKDDLERSYFQYKCQMKVLGWIYKFSHNIAAIPLNIYYKHKLRTNQCIATNRKIEAIFLCDLANDIIPSSLENEYCIEQITGYQKDMMLSSEDVCFINRIFKRYPLAPFFCLKCMLKIAIYSYHINKYSPKAIIVSEEYSFTSSILSTYCKEKGVKHINVMHGEKLFDITDSYFRFDKCYIWDGYYLNLFIDLMAEEKQFQIEKPMAQTFKKNTDKEIDYTYYLGAESKPDMISISRSLQMLQNKGYVVAVRPHPRYSNISDVNSAFDGIIIENAKDVSVFDSILRTKHVVSLYSTVLGQAFNNNVDVVIDDMNFPDKYIKLKDLRFRYVCGEHDCLSQHI